MKLSCLSAVKRKVQADGGLGGRPEPEAPYVDAVAVMDRSGSMSHLLPGSREGVKIWLEKQRVTKNGRTEVVTFDDRVELPYCGYSSAMAQSDIERVMLALTARGWTRLYDTAVEAIHRQMKRLEAWRAGLPNRRMLNCLDMAPVAILFVLTDGEDNMSKVADEAAFNRAVSRTKRLWNTLTIFAAANQNARRAGERYGFAAETILQMDAAPEAVAAVFRSATASQGRAVSGAPPAMSALERQSSAPSHYQNPSAPAALIGGGGGVLPLTAAARQQRQRMYQMAAANAQAAQHLRPQNMMTSVSSMGGGGGRGCSSGYVPAPRGPFQSPLPPWSLTQSPLPQSMAPPPPRPRFRRTHAGGASSSGGSS